MFGEEEILQYRNRNFSVKCDSIDGTLYFLRKADFLQIVQDDPEQKYEFLSLAFHKKQLHKMRKIQIKEKISQYKSYIYEDRMKIEQENKSLIYLDSNNKPKSKLDLNEYLNNNKQKDPTIRSDFSPNRNSVTRIPSPNVQQNKRSFSLSSLHFKNLIQKQMAFQTPTKINQEEVVGREQQMPNSQKQINSNNNISIESERMMTQLEKFPSRLLSLQTLNSPRSVDQYQQSSFALVNTPRKKKSSEISKLNFNLPILNLDKIAQQNFIEYSPRRYLNKNLRNTNRQKKSQSQHIQDDNVDQYIFLDSSSNFCTHRSEIKPKIINIQSTGIDEEALKKSKNVSQQVDNLILSQKYKNYQQTLDFFKNYQPINPRKMYKDIINEHSFNNLYQIKLAEKNKLYDKKEKTFNFIQLQQGLKSIQDITKKRSLQSLISQNQIPSSSTLIQIQSLIKLDEDLPDQINSKNANVPQKITLPIQLEGTFNYKKFDLKEQIQLNQQKTENQLPNELNHTNSNQISIKKLATPKQIISIKNLASNLNNFSKLDKNSIQQKDSVQLRKNSLSKLNKILQSKY